MAGRARVPKAKVFLAGAPREKLGFMGRDGMPLVSTTLLGGAVLGLKWGGSSSMGGRESLPPTPPPALPPDRPPLFLLEEEEEDWPPLPLGWWWW